jgi:hypothetical protein
MNFIAINMNWMPKRATWLRPVAKAHCAGGGKFGS